MNPVGPYNPYAEKQGLCAIRVFTDGGPPRQHHDREENTIFTIRRKFVPTTIADGIPQKWPLLHVVFLWLSNCPPFHPLSPIGVGADDGGHLLKQMLPSFQPGL